MLKKIFELVLRRSEKRIGVTFDYARKIAQSDSGLFLRYGKIFGFLDPRKHLPADAYHAARICGALSADCGTCVEAEINLAKNAGVDPVIIGGIVSRDVRSLAPSLGAIVELSFAVTQGIDAPEAREAVLNKYGQNGLIEASFAMNGAALLPGIKRSMGYATSCDIAKMRDLAATGKTTHNKPL